VWGGDGDVPKISEFYGILIYIYFSDHAPPHFHAIYGEHEAEIAIADGRVLEGRVPNRALALIREWAQSRRSELLEDWDRARRHEPLFPIAPLD